MYCVLLNGQRGCLCLVVGVFVLICIAHFILCLAEVIHRRHVFDVSFVISFDTWPSHTKYSTLPTNAYAAFMGVFCTNTFSLLLTCSVAV